MDIEYNAAVSFYRVEFRAIKKSIIIHFLFWIVIGLLMSFLAFVGGVKLNIIAGFEHPALILTLVFSTASFMVSSFILMPTIAALEKNLAYREFVLEYENLFAAVLVVFANICFDILVFISLLVTRAA